MTEVVKLTKAKRDEFDLTVLRAATEWSPNATYVLRNRISRQSRGSKLTTAQVLRACRRLEKAGMIQQFHNSGYAVMLVWEITPAWPRIPGAIMTMRPDNPPSDNPQGTQMTNLDQIVALVGSKAELARVLGRDKAQVTRFKARGSVPWVYNAVLMQWASEFSDTELMSPLLEPVCPCCGQGRVDLRATEWYGAGE